MKRSPRIFFVGLFCIIWQGNINPVCGSDLTLARALELCRANNASLKAALNRIDATRGSNVAALSRLLPHLDLIYRSGSAGQSDTTVPSSPYVQTSEEALEIALRQRLAEFGPSTDASWDRIRSARSSLLSAEDTAAAVISKLRLTYFTLGIMQTQLEQHDLLLLSYSGKLEKETNRLETGIGRKNAVLTARLNILDEKERILALQNGIHVTAAGLRELCGIPAIGDSLKPTTRADSLRIAEDSCVTAAAAASSRIAWLQYETDFAKRRLLQRGWNFFPDARLQAGIRSGRSAAGVAIAMGDPSSERRWSVDAVGTQRLLATPSGAVSADSFVSNDRTVRYTASLTLDLPLFRGMSEAGEIKEAGAQYNLARNQLLAAVRSLETAVRSTWYEYQRSQQQLAIAEERIAIARERYTLAETMLELEKISDEGCESFRQQLFGAQDAYFSQQLQTLGAGEALRLLIRRFEP